MASESIVDGCGGCDGGVAVVSMECPYTKSAIIKAFKRHLKHWEVSQLRNPMAESAEEEDDTDGAPPIDIPFGGRLIAADDDTDDEDTAVETSAVVNEEDKRIWEDTIERVCLQWSDYEQLEWKRVLKGNLVASAYFVRKGLIRKAQLAFNVEKFLAKAPSDAALRRGFPQSFPITIYHADYVDEALCDLPEVKYMEPGSSTWILKPNLTNRGTGIELFDSCERFVEIIEDEENEDIREWVVQRYIEAPLLVDNRKFHLRAYVLAVGALKVYFFKDVLALFSLEPYPSMAENKDISNYAAHLTNTCFQHTVKGDSSFVEDKAVRLWTELADELEDGQQVVDFVTDSMHRLTGEVFEACAGEVGFFPVPNCFELFGLDFLIESKSVSADACMEDKYQLYLLEINAEPDFVQTGDRLRVVVEDLLDESTRLLTSHFFPSLTSESMKAAPLDKLRLIYEQEESPYMAGGSSMRFRE